MYDGMIPALIVCGLSMIAAGTMGILFIATLMGAYKNKDKGGK